VYGGLIRQDFASLLGLKAAKMQSAFGCISDQSQSLFCIEIPKDKNMKTDLFSAAHDSGDVKPKPRNSVFKHWSIRELRHKGDYENTRTSKKK